MKEGLNWLENHRYWDVKRWKIANDVLNEDLLGMTIVKTGDNQFTYTRKSSRATILQ